MALIGYARVSTDDQDLRPQLDALTAAGVEKIYSEHVSSTAKRRPQLDAALEYMREGDVLVVWSLDRLSRSLYEFVNLMESFDDRGLQFRSLTQPFDTTTSAGRMVTGMLAVVAQLEREMISARTRAGLDAARAQGRVGGRPTRLTDRRLTDLATLRVKHPKMSQRDLAKELEISERSVSRGLAYLRASGSLT